MEDIIIISSRVQFSYIWCKVRLVSLSCKRYEKLFHQPKLMLLNQLTAYTYLSVYRPQTPIPIPNKMFFTQSRELVLKAISRLKFRYLHQTNKCNMSLSHIHYIMICIRIYTTDSNKLMNLA